MSYDLRVAHGFLVDMDGVIYRGAEVMPGAQVFIARLLRERIPFLFLTNNSQRTRRDVATRLNRMGFEVTPNHVFTCAIATARYLAGIKPKGTAYVIGEGGLLAALHEHGYSIVDSDPDFVVIGEGRTVTMEMVDRAVTFVSRGAKLIATNLDPNCPTAAGGIRAGCGAYTAMIEQAAGAKAFGIGKPSPLMMRAARKEIGLTTAETIMIGDTMETDILGGVQLGFRTILVLTGSTTRAKLVHYAYGPDLVVDSIADLATCDFGHHFVPAPGSSAAA